MTNDTRRANGLGRALAPRCMGCCTCSHPFWSFLCWRHLRGAEDGLGRTCLCQVRWSSQGLTEMEADHEKQARARDVSVEAAWR